MKNYIITAAVVVLITVCLRFVGLHDFIAGVIATVIWMWTLEALDNNDKENEEKERYFK